METQMSRPTLSWRQFAAVAAISLLAACNQSPPPTAASNPPPVAPGPSAVWYTVSFDTGSFVVDANGKKVVDDVIGYLGRNPNSVVTVIGRTDTAGSKEYN